MTIDFTTSNVTKSLAAILVLWLSFRLLVRFLRRRKYRLPPGPFTLPLLGHVGSVDHVTLLNHREKYGDVSYMNVLGIDIVVLNSVEVIRDAFLNPRSAEVFSNRPPSFIKRELIKDDVVLRSIGADHWIPLRRIFHSLLKQYGERMVGLERVFVKELNVVIDSFNAKLNQDVNVDSIIQPSLINIVSILMIGERYERDHWMIGLPLDMLKTGNAICHPFVDMLLRTFSFFLYIPIGPGRVYRQLTAGVQRCLCYLYRDRKNLSSDELKSRMGVVYEMMKLRDKHPWMRDSMIEGVILNMYFAGYLATDALLRAFFLLMLHYPDVQAGIQKEIDNVVGSERQPSLSDRASMPYTVATILELSRYSSVNALSIPHACAEDTEFRGYTVPRDAVIVPNLFRVHHDAELWTNPWTFDPTRFLDDSGDILPATHPRRRNLIPFGVGKRVCVGEVFGKTRIFLYITYLLQTFSLKPAQVVPSCDPRKFALGMVLDPPRYTLRMDRRK